MTSFILAMLIDSCSGTTRQRMESALAFNTPPQNTRARQLATRTLVLFLTAVLCLLVASLLDSLLGNRFVSEVFGWSGLAVLQICVLCGVRYANINYVVEDDAQTSTEDIHVP